MNGGFMGAVKLDRIARYVEFIGREDALRELVDRMCGVTGRCEGLPEICRDLDIPYGKVLAWILADAGRYGRYMDGLKLQREILADEAAAGVDEVVGIADEVEEDKVAIAKANARISARKLRAEFRVGLASVMTPERYGKKLVNEQVVSLTADAGLLGAAADLLRLVKRNEVVVEGEVLENGRC
jgi:hypothetical protein